MKRIRRPFTTGSFFLLFVCACVDSRPPERAREAAASEGATDGRVVLHLGVLARSDPRLTLAGSRPLADYLGERTPYRIELRVGRSTEDVELDVGVQDLLTYLEERLVEIAPLGALSFCIADERFGAVPLAHTRNDEGEPLERGLFVVSRDSPLRRIEDLRGRKLALGPSHSTTSHLLALHELQEAELPLEALERVENLETDEAVLEGVRSGGYDAGAVSELSLEDDDALRVLHAFEPVPSRALVVREDLPATVRESLREALLELDVRDPSRWDGLLANGFAPSSDGDYDRVRRIANEQAARCAGGCHEPVAFREGT